jgi:hypothetical protein
MHGGGVGQRVGGVGQRGDRRSRHRVTAMTQLRSCRCHLVSSPYTPLPYKRGARTCNIRSQKKVQTLAQFQRTPVQISVFQHVHSFLQQLWQHGLVAYIP